MKTIPDVLTIRVTAQDARNGIPDITDACAIAMAGLRQYAVETLHVNPGDHAVACDENGLSRIPAYTLLFDGIPFEMPQEARDYAERYDTLGRSDGWTELPEDWPEEVEFIFTRRNETCI